VGFLACCVGIYAAQALITAAQVHLQFQVYKEYLEAGGETIPVKVEENDTTTLQAPTGPAAGTVKLSSGGAPGTGGKAAANGNGKTTTKGKAAPKATPKKRKK
jgi:hypothetical protein